MEGQPNEPTNSFGFSKYETRIFMLLTIVSMLCAGVISVFPVLGFSTGGVRAPNLQVHELDAFGLYDTVIHPIDRSRVRGPNDVEVTWAVFFFKPYCGACRRVRPVFEAMARTTNATSHLRFASIDCVQYKTFCEKEGVEKQPRILLYKDVDRQEAVSRSPVAVWSGMLIAHEIFTWFQTQQHAGHIHQDVEWPEDGKLADAMLAFKAKGTAQVDAVMSLGELNRTGYFKDIESAFHMGLVDHVFAKDPVLKGTRLHKMHQWLKTVASTYPIAEVRQSITELLSVLKQRKEWSREPYEAALQKWGVKPVTDADWSWCELKSAGVGGYPCGLWTLFHVIMANSDQFTGPDHLRAIEQWVGAFFGCTECATHFRTMWLHQDAVSQKGHIDTSTWLWEAHNLVRERLMEDDTTTNKEQWPPQSMCEECFTESARNGTAPMSDQVWLKEQWQYGYIFEFLQEVYCFKSDTLSCAQFWDPSVAGSSSLPWKLIGSAIGMVLLVAGAIMLILMFEDKAGNAEPSVQPKQRDAQNNSHVEKEGPKIVDPQAAAKMAMAAKLDAKKDKAK